DGWTTAERVSHLMRGVSYLEDLALSVWRGTGESGRRVVAAFLLALHAAAEHQVSPPNLEGIAYTLRQLGYEQVLASLPAYADGRTPELAQLTTAARLCVGANTNVRSRYSQMRAIADDSATGVNAP